MKCLFTLLTVTCFFHVVSSQGDGDSYAGLGYLKPVIEERIRQCGQMWMDRCVSNETSIPTGLCRCAPYFELSSEEVQTVHLGKSVTLFCLFYGYPLPAILWTGPQGRLPVGRHKKTNWETTIILTGITTSDEGNYSCSASNMFGRDKHALQLQVVAAAEFKHTIDGPYNVTVTEGESVTFNCNPFAIPEANIVWLQNEQPIDTANPPERFVFSNDNRSLTIRDVCRDCVDRESKTDLMVIQCNASNDHGYTVAQGYLNVLLKTRVTIKGPENTSVDFLEEKQFVFQCNVTSDPTTPATVRWYKTEPFEDLVRDDPPYINVTDEFLIITIHPKCSAECFKYLGEYRCVGYNGYSRDNETITVVANAYKLPSKARSQKDETWAPWKIVLTAGAIGLSLLLVGIFLRFRSKLHVRSDDVERRMEVSKVLSYPSVYEDIGYETSDFPLEENAGNRDVLKTRKQSVYDRIGYESIDQVLEEIALKEEAMPHAPSGHGYVGYETIDASSERAKGSHRQFLDEKMTRNNMGYSISLGDALYKESMGRNQVRGQSNEQSESVRNYSDRNLADNPPDTNQEEQNSYLDLVSTKVCPYLDLVSTEGNQYLDLVSTEVKLTQDLVSAQVNPYTALVSTETNLTQDLVSTQVNPYTALVSTETNLTQDLVSTEVNPYMALVSTEVNKTQDIVSTEANPYLELVSADVNPYLEPVLTDVNPYLELVSTDVNPYLELVSTDVNPYLELVSTEANPYLELVSTEVNPYLELVSTDVNPYLELVSTDVNPYLEFVSSDVNPYLELVSTDVNPYLELVSTEVNPYLELVSTEVNPYLELVSTDVSLNLELVSTKHDFNLAPESKGMN